MQKCPSVLLQPVVFLYGMCSNLYYSMVLSLHFNFKKFCPPLWFGVVLLGFGVWLLGFFC